RWLTGGHDDRRSVTVIAFNGGSAALSLTDSVAGQQAAEGDGVQAGSFTDGDVDQVAGVGVDAEGQAGVVGAGLPPALVGQRDRVGQGDVGQGVGRGVRHGAWHVGDAVENRVVHRVGRVGVGGRVRVLEATALVDGYVHQDRAWLHPRHELVGHQRGGLGPGDQHGPDDQVGAEHRALDLEGVAGEGLYLAAVDLVDGAEPVDVEVEQEDLGLHAGCDGGGVQPGDAGADHHDLG